MYRCVVREWSRLGHWLTLVRNRRELAEGWYDPATLQKAVASTHAYDEAQRDDRSAKRQRRESLDGHKPQQKQPSPVQHAKLGLSEDSDSDDSIGPTLPGRDHPSRTSRMGPSIPNMQDLELKRGK